MKEGKAESNPRTRLSSAFGHRTPGPAFLLGRRTSRFWSRAAACRYAFILAWLLAVTAWGQSLSPPPPEEPQTLYIVRLDQPGAVELLTGRTYPGVSLLRAPGGREELLRAAASVEAAQDRWIAEYLTVPELQVVGRATRVANQIFVRGPAELASSLANLPGVQGVYPAAERKLLLDSAPQEMHIDALWALLGGAERAGEGVKVGILDTGISIGHPMMRPSGMSVPGGYPRGERAFTNAKVIVARSFHQLFPFPPTAAEDKTPADQDGHGTAVAAIVGGRATIASQVGTTVQGIAPRAWLGNYKIFGTGVNNTTTSAAVIAAVDQAVADGMDVLNLSLGGPPPSDPNDPELEAIRNAVAAGVVVVAAAGNEGPQPGTITSPAIAPEALAVGAVTHARKFAAVLHVEAPGLSPELADIAYVAGSGSSIQSTFGPFPLRGLTALDPSRQACSPLGPGALAGTIALVRRGECFFQVKLDNVAAAGARAMIVYDNTDGPEVIMALDNPVIPAVFIAREPGEALQALVDRLPPASVLARLDPSFQLRAFPATGDQIADFSSRGPGYEGAVKPDLVAVGSAVLSAALPTGFTLTLNGTSFAAPMVAGAAALLRQLHPDWTPEQIKSALMTTAAPVVMRTDGTPAGIYEAGAGRLDLSRVADVRLAVDVPAVHFFPEAGENAGPRRIVVANLAVENVTVRVGFESRRGDPGLAVTATPDRFTLAPGGAQSLEARCTVAPGTPGGELEGALLLVDEGRGVTQRVAVRCLALGDAPRRVLQVSQSGAAVGAFRTIQSALEVARPGDIIEITDQGPYPEVLHVGRTKSGLEPDGLVIRSTGPSRAILDGSNAAGDLPVIDVAGAEGVRIESLEIRGGGIGIRFTSGASGVVQGCRVSSRRLGFFADGIEVRGGSRAVVLDTLIDNGGGSGIGVRDPDSQALVIGNTLGDREGHRPLEYHGIHVYNGGSAYLMDNTIFAGGAGREQHGALVELGNLYLLQGNRLARGSGDGDGIHLKNGFVESIASVFEGHRGRGLHAEFSDFSLDFDLLRNNASAGLGSTEADGQVSRTTFENNGVGIQLDSGALTLTNSLITSSARQGIFAERTRNLVLRYVTVAGNGAEGLLGSNLQGGTMIGAILHGNGARDVSVTGSLLTGDSLVGSAQGLTPLSDANLLNAVNPRFSSAAGGDYSLLPGSPAIDLVRSFSLLDLTDLAGHLRNADGDHDGNAFPDAGAFEAESPFASPLAVPHASRNGWFTGLAFTNSWVRDDGTTSNFQIEVRGYGPDGTRFGVSSLQVTEETQTAKLSGELLPGASPAWLEVLPEHPYVKGFVLQGDEELQRLDGVALQPPWAGEIHFVGLGEREASHRLLVINPSPKPVAIVILEHPSPSGQSRFETLPPFGTLELAAADLSPQTEFVTVFSQDASRLAGFTELETSESFAVLPALSEKEFGFELYGAQLAVTPALRSRLELISPVADTTATIEVLDDDGNVVAQRSVSLVGGHLYAADLGAALGLTNFVGWLRVRTADSPLKVAGAVVFGAADGRYLAALPLQPWPTGGRVSVFSHVAQGGGLFTGVTLLNPGAEPALYALEVYDSEGNLLGRSAGELCAGCKRARVLPEWVPGFGVQWGGWIRLRSSRPLFGFELFGNGEYLAAVPQQVVVP
ncbi:MAG: hypothetical protein Kow00109_21340 [Acidobacteriota bacterium]